MGFSRQTVTRMFEKEPGFSILERPQANAQPGLSLHSHPNQRFRARNSTSDGMLRKTTEQAKIVTRLYYYCVIK